MEEYIKKEVTPKGHIVLKLDSKDLKVFIDGVKKTTIANSPALFFKFSTFLGERKFETYKFYHHTQEKLDTTSKETFIKFLSSYMGSN